MRFEDAMRMIAGQPDMVELFGGAEGFKKQNDAAKLQQEARRSLAVALAAIAATPDGQRLFDYLSNAYLYRFNNVTALGLPSETAIQLHASADGQKELVVDLLRLVHEGRNPS